ncbi:MAG: hypothetical protein FWB96_07685, partial [Defluviitaleaceae bacterium]|nr:hypothetical protein [Defluviitaleaceae bacterium]
MNLNRILYSMCYDMLEQKYIAHKTENGLAIACPQTPLWIWLAQGTTTADARLFFDGFLRQNPPPLTGIVAEKKFAIPCAEMYTQTKRREQHNTAAAFSQKELISYFLPPGVSLPSDAPLHGELRPPSPTEMPTILAWINAFYSETLQTSPPQKLKFEGEGGSG